MNEFEYYLIERDGKYASPLLMNDDEFDEDGTMFLRNMEKVEEGTTVHLAFMKSPQKPDMTDYLWLSGGRSVFSKKIYDILKDTAVKDFQLVSAIIKDPKGNEYSDYWIAGIYREFAFLSEEESEFDSKTSSGRWSGIEKMVINEEEMAKVPLAERLIYVGKESSAYVFYHKSIVDAIMSVNPTGVRFVRVEDWTN
ncbi:MAG: hypothetical protein LBV18_00180 [Alistipes sp.]|jgi:hypothetical protein|nr:hypothetical protein [Alistipes sp.]